MLARSADSTNELASVEEDQHLIARSFEMFKGEGKVIMCACTAEQKAYESAITGHGRFTGLLLEGLNGAAADFVGEVTVNSLYDFISRGMKQANQQPMFFGNITGLLVLVKTRGAAESKRTVIGSKENSATHPVYAHLLAEAKKLCMLDDWERWTSFPLASVPSWEIKWIDSIQEFRRRFKRARLPGQNPEFERALPSLPRVRYSGPFRPRQILRLAQSSPLSYNYSYE